jgi:GTP diphosphokinase / guanosine-3',5'-bis(diphosphate) 3'-diphosphatase
MDQVIPPAGYHLEAATAVIAREENVAGATSVEPLIASLRSLHPDADTQVVRRAHEFARKAHEGQRRFSGEPYITHTIAVATIVAELGLDETSIAAALLHDVVEDTPVPIDQIESEFGTVIAQIVDGVTKLDRLNFSTKEAQQAATIRKMVIAMAKDWRVLVIKLADRLHNMRTIDVMPEWKQRRTAQQTLDVYAPLAHRLGIQQIKWQLEDLSFRVLQPKVYEEIAHMVATRAPSREQEVADVLEQLKSRLSALGIQATVTGRPKHLWSIYEKMVVRSKEFDEINDLVGIRIIVESDKDCWSALGAVHAAWPPVQGRFKDYINSPKFNLYQSLHTTVIGPRGKPLEIQIRTTAMHLRAEHGIAAHWGYKEGGGRAGTHLAEVEWLQRLVDWEKETPDPIEFLETLKLDLEQDEVYVFTPKGEIMTLPTGSTPVDFAYSIHTEVGHRCIGARVNGRLAPLDAKLQSGDTVEILTSKLASAGPSKDWLKIAASPRARNKIRQWFSRERREDAIDNGRDEITKALRREGLPIQRIYSSGAIDSLAKAFGFSDLDAFYAAVGEAHISGKAAISRLRRDILSESEEQLPTTVLQTRRPTSRKSTGVFVEGLDDVLVRLSSCCTPVPGDRIVGFVTRGRGVSVHRADCVNAITLDSAARERLIEVEWDEAQSGRHTASIAVEALDRAQLLADVARALGEQNVGIISVSAESTPDRVSHMRFECELVDTEHLEAVLAALRRVEGVYDAFRLLPGKNKTARAQNR